MSQQRPVMQQRAGAITVFTLAAALMAVPATASSIQVTGTTAGCFGADCTTFGPVATDDTYGLTFGAAGLFNVSTDDFGNASDIWLGSFVRGNVNVPNSTDPLPFTLKVQFGMPTGIGDELIEALITGTNHGGGGALDVDFDNAWQLVTFENESGSGSFEFAVTNDLDVTKNGSDDVHGGIRNAMFTPTVTVIENVSTVPEPASVALFGVGLLLVANRVRRRKN